MPYLSDVELRAENYVRDNWVYPEATHGSCSKTTSLKKHILSRVAYLALAPCSGPAAIGDTILGLGAGVAAIFTLGRHEKIFSFADANLQMSHYTLAYFHINILKTLNPKAKVLGNMIYVQASASGFKQPLISDYGNGFIADKVMNVLKRQSRIFRSSTNPIKRHIVSRLTYSLMGLAAIVTRTADGVIALVATPLSFITLGKIESINNLAFRSLQFLGIIHDVWYCSIKIVNPQAGVFSS